MTDNDIFHHLEALADDAPAAAATLDEKLRAAHREGVPFVWVPDSEELPN